MSIRSAEPRDVPALIAMVLELAEYENAPEQAIATEADFTRDLFGESPRVHALVVEVSDEVVAYAFYFLNYSTWLGRHGIFLEDLYVRPEGYVSGTNTGASWTNAFQGWVAVQWGAGAGKVSAGEAPWDKNSTRQSEGKRALTKSRKAATTLSGSCWPTSRNENFALACAGKTVFEPLPV